MISFVYFDLGGVVIKDFSASPKWAEMLEDMGVDGQNQQAFDRLWSKYAGRICLDQDIDDLIPPLRSEVDLHLPAGYSWLNDFIDRFEPNYSIWPVIETVQQSYRIGILTNMYPRMLDGIQGSGLLPPVAWDIVIDSSVECCQKPDKRIFDIAREKAGVPLEKILFVENSQEHITAAQTLGWQTFYYDSANYTQSSQQLSEYLQSKAGNG